ncbi:MAG: hypothetical protein N3A71_01480 [Candidatus Dojkabacteria bacterium]|nr:hypothetical protein [Candidatus Dojkabacteria bacterium]
MKFFIAIILTILSFYLSIGIQILSAPLPEPQISSDFINSNLEYPDQFSPILFEKIIKQTSLVNNKEIYIYPEANIQHSMLIYTVIFFIIVYLSIIFFGRHPIIYLPSILGSLLATSVMFYLMLNYQNIEPKTLFLINNLRNENNFIIAYVVVFISYLTFVVFQSMSKNREDKIKKSHQQIYYNKIKFQTGPSAPSNIIKNN